MRQAVLKALRMLFFENCFQNVEKFWGRTVKQNADTVYLGRQNADNVDRGDKHCDRYHNLVPRDGTHRDTREHCHRRGEGNIGANSHKGAVHVAGRHRHHYH